MGSQELDTTFHAKMGTKKDRNDMDLTEAEDIKKRKGRGKVEGVTDFLCLGSKKTADAEIGRAHV